MKYYARPVIIALSTALLWGCTSIQPTDTSREPDATAADQETAKSPGDAETEPAEPAPLPTREFPIDSFYSLLVAEVASHRGRYDIELGHYIQEAHRTRDPGVAARATRIARYLDASQATLETAQLWVELEPENTEALFILATELAKNGQLLDAFKHSEKLLNLDSTPIFESIAARAGQATDTQRESLLAEFDRLLVRHPDNIQLLVGKSMLLHRQGNLDQALSQVRKALALQDSDVPAVALEARLLYELEQPQKALDRLSTLLQKKPKNRRLRLEYARMLANIDLIEAQQQFEILVNQSPEEPELLLSLGLVANEVGNVALARESFTHLLEMGEETDTAHFYLGRIEADAGNTKAALRHFQEVRQGPDFLPALGQTLDILVSQGEMAEARETMRDARRRFGSAAERLYLLEAEVLARHQHLDAAEALLTEALTLHPTSTDLLYSRALINEQRDMIQLTEEDLRTIIRYQPNNAAALNALGYTLADRTDRYQEAYELISQALSIEPDDPSIIDSMGWVQYRLGNHRDAVAHLREAMESHPDHEIAAHLGEVLWVMGKKQEARDVWSRGLKLNPGSNIIPRVLKHLEVEL